MDFLHDITYYIQFSLNFRTTLLTCISAINSYNTIGIMLFFFEHESIICPIQFVIFNFIYLIIHTAMPTSCVLLGCIIFYHVGKGSWPRKCLEFVNTSGPLINFSEVSANKFAMQVNGQDSCIKFCTAGTNFCHPCE